MRKKIGLVLALVSFTLLSTVLLIYLWPSPDSGWDYYTEPSIYSAMEEVDVNGIIYSLEPYMWRDFMPSSPPDGKPLIVFVRIHALGVDIFPSRTKIGRLWLIDGLNVISALPTEEFSVNGNVLEMVFRNGPKWGPGITVDVIVKLNDNNFPFCVKAVNQTIQRTD